VSGGGGERERFELRESGSLIHYEHAHRYVFAAAWLRERNRPARVLDLACGSGYGTPLLRATGANVVALDLERACAREAGPGVCARGEALPFPDGAFDCVVCFEAIEHVAEPEAIVAEIARVLAPEGAAFVSTPNRPLYTDAAARHNPFHLRELDRGELAAMLGRHFAHAEILGQSVWAGSWIAQAGGSGEFETAELPAQLAPPEVEAAPWSRGGSEAPPTPLYFVALCAREASHAKELRAFAQRAHLLHDREQRLIGELLAAQRGVGERDAEIESQSRHAREIERERDRARDRIASLEQNETNVRAELAREASEHASLRSHVENLERELASARERAAGSDEHAANLERRCEEARARAADLEAHAANLEADLARERERASGSDRHAANLARLRDEAIARASGLEVHVANLEADLARERERASGSDRHAANLERLRDEARARVAELETHAANLESHRDEARARVSALDSHIANLEGDLRERGERVRGLEAHAANVEALRDAHAARIEALERHASNLDARIAEREERVSGLEAHTANLEQAARELTERAQGAELLAEELRAARESALQRLRLAETERNRMQEARDAAGRQRDAATAALERLRNAFFVRALAKLGLVRDRDRD